MVLICTAVTAAVADQMTEFGERNSLVSCGTALAGEVGEMCSLAGVTDGGVCDQGTLLPRCLPADEAGWDECGCPPGWGWDGTLRQCGPGKSTSTQDVCACRGPSHRCRATSGSGQQSESQGVGLATSASTSIEPHDGGGGRGDGSSSGSGSGFKVIIAIVVFVVVGLAGAHAKGLLCSKIVSESTTSMYDTGGSSEAIDVSTQKNMI
eukprot:COSAG02_NODE_1841_length_10705_cov_28.897794_4_plen_208_part_00